MYMTASDQATLLLVSVSLLLSHTETAQERCTEGELRLITRITGTRPGVISGSVQYCVNGTLNMVCRTGSNPASYNVLCRQLGYTYNSQANNPANCSYYSSVSKSTCVECGDGCDQVLKVTCQTWQQVVNQALSMCTDSSSTTNLKIDYICQGMTSVPEAEPTSSSSSTSGPEKVTHHPTSNTKNNGKVSTPQKDDTSTSTKNSISHDQCLKTTIPLGSVLGAVVAVLVVSLMVTCALWRREVAKQQNPFNPPDPDPLTLYRNERHTHQFDNHIYSATTPSTPDPHSDPHSDLGSNYHMITTNSEQVDTYAAIDHNQQHTHTPQSEPVTPTPVRGETSRREDDFYDAEEHTYSVVDKKRAKKTPEDGEEEPPDYEMAMTGETSWGVMNGESSQQAETT